MKMVVFFVYGLFTLQTRFLVYDKTKTIVLGSSHAMVNIYYNTDSARGKNIRLCSVI